MEQVDPNFKLRLLLSGLRVTCCYFTGDAEVCKLSEKGPFDGCWCACNCDGNTDQCDLPKEFHVNLD